MFVFSRRLGTAPAWVRTNTDCVCKVRKRKHAIASAKQTCYDPVTKPTALNPRKILSVHYLSKQNAALGNARTGVIGAPNVCEELHASQLTA